MVGVSQQSVSEFIKVAALGPGVSAGDMLLAYCERLREQAAGRWTEGELDLAQERALLAREQRVKLALENAKTRKEYAPVGALADVLAMAGQSVAAKLDALPGLLAKVAPDTPAAAREAIAAAVAKARNEWVDQVASLEVRIDPIYELADDDGSDDGADAPHDADGLAV